jgi:drug/metabolite transporter (DMT)-like permease
MLAAMGERSFVVVIAFIKTEPIPVALFGFVLLGDKLSLPTIVAILIATAGVLTMSFKPGSRGGLKATLLGLAAGAMFGLSAIGYRGGILALHDAGYVLAATFTLAVGLVLQAALLSAYLLLRDRAVLIAIVRAWRPSLFAGFMGALASQFWFLAFALATAASVRTLALMEVLFAQAISHFAFGQPTSRREAIGIALIVAGVVLLIRAS